MSALESGTAWSYGHSVWVLLLRMAFCLLRLLWSGIKGHDPMEGRAGAGPKLSCPSLEGQGTAACRRHVWKGRPASCCLHLLLSSPSSAHLVSELWRGWYAKARLSLHFFPASLGLPYGPGFLQEIFATCLRTKPFHGRLACSLSCSSWSGRGVCRSLSHGDEAGYVGQHEACWFPVGCAKPWAGGVRMIGCARAALSGQEACLLPMLGSPVCGTPGGMSGCTCGSD